MPFIYIIIYHNYNSYVKFQICYTNLKTITGYVTVIPQKIPEFEKVKFGLKFKRNMRQFLHKNDVYNH